MRRRGFTLLETLVALGLTALVLAALEGAVVRAAGTRARVSAAAERAAAGRSVLLRLAAELEAAPVADDPRQGFTVAPAVDAAHPWTVLRFTTHARNGGAARVVTYRVESDAARPGTGRLLRLETFSPAPPASPASPDPLDAVGLPVLDRIRDFRVRCFDGSVWRTEWAPGELPRVVEIGIGVDDGMNGMAELRTAASLPTAR
jgi:prepilin-type N-terminal cleavage/methylation domain-containing protein